MFDLTYLHPMIVHFPIALLIIGLFADIIGVIFKKEFYMRTALYLLVLGTLGVVAAYFSGDFAGEGIVEAGSLKNALETHEDAAKITVWVMSFVAVTRLALVLMKKYKGLLPIVSVLLFAVGVLTMARTAHYGGQLVYKHAAGVQLQIGSLPAVSEEETKDND
ncbi:MAG: hypothetical protein PHP42_01140 [Bacteroidota bacterium]|nr:hypothetical protein [Bacteroidota bacterium]